MASRVGALEERVGLISKDAAAARVLAGGADRDVADISTKLDVHKSLIQALRTTQIDQGKTLQTLHRTQTDHGTRLDAMQETLDGMQGTLTEHGQRLTRLESEMKAGFAKVDSSMQATYAKLAAGQAVITDLLTRHLDDGSTN
ncbi:hypothetical protein [Actinocrispum sp. NPDC049592]|uniref:hypothetical protein n=1 Tax=Actinocrispum sp. NPDC049592 TaxID=3154835 RepID=UPI003448C16D